MALRLIEIQLSKDKEQETKDFFNELENASVWEFSYSEHSFFAKIVIEAEDTENIMDAFEKKYSHDQNFKLILHSLEAVIPRLKEDEKKSAPDEAPEKGLQRVSREELYNDIQDSCKLNKIYIIMVILSSIVASIGIMKQNIPAIIGSMVIAPLLGPNVALSFACTLGDIKLAVRSLLVNVSGMSAALFVAIGVGFFSKRYIADHWQMLTLSVDFSDILLALSAGAAGALAFTSGVPAVLIGVMVAVALLPPLVNFGLFIGSGLFSMAWTAVLIVIINVISVNLSAIVTFYFQGVRALSWWEEGKAKKLRTVAFLIWISLLVLFFILIYVIDLKKSFV